MDELPEMYCAEVLPGASASMMLGWLWRTLMREDSATLGGRGVMTDVVDILIDVRWWTF